MAIEYFYVGFLLGLIIAFPVACWFRWDGQIKAFNEGKDTGYAQGYRRCYMTHVSPRNEDSS